MRLLLLILLTCMVYAGPESQIIVAENFISNEAATALRQYYDEERKSPNTYSDNELSFASMANPQIKKIIRDISEEVIQLMHRYYPLMGKTYRLDHGGLYARIAPNYCSYHADNVIFVCPTHGSNQQKLRTICPGTCPGAKSVPNHTSWREYTALIYLNDEFEGGEIAFEDGPQNRQYKKTIPIQANLLVLAPNGSDFYHEVFPIRKGKRYSLHLWFTSDPQHWH